MRFWFSFVGSSFQRNAFLHQLVKSDVQNRNDGKALIAGFLALNILAPLLFLPVLYAVAHIAG